MPVFNPPTDPDVRFVDPLDSGLGSRLGSHLQPLDRGRNVYKLTDGSYVEWQPVFADIAKVFYGGHETEVTDAEAAELIAAGYGDYIT
jgi:hypothetical protein